MLVAEFAGIARIQIGAFVQLRVAVPEGIHAQAANAIPHGAVKHLVKMSRVCAVDHAVRGITRRGLVGACDRIVERIARRRGLVIKNQMSR